MHQIKEVSSGDARKRWREVLDQVASGQGDVAISRYGEVVAVLIPADDYERLAEELEEIRLSRIAEGAYAEYLAERERATSYEDLRAELIEES